METFVKDYKVDGFRCDVADTVPLDFWADAFTYLKTINPELLTFNEGRSNEYLEVAFDMAYDFNWTKTMIDVFANKAPAKKKPLSNSSIHMGIIIKILQRP